MTYVLSLSATLVLVFLGFHNLHILLSFLKFRTWIRIVHSGMIFQAPHRLKITRIESFHDLLMEDRFKMSLLSCNTCLSSNKIMGFHFINTSFYLALRLFVLVVINRYIYQNPPRLEGIVVSRRMAYVFSISDISSFLLGFTFCLYYFLFEKSEG